MVDFWSLHSVNPVKQPPALGPTKGTKLLQKREIRECP
jgi:hypothetical protein